MIVIYARHFPHSAKIRMTARLTACGRMVGVSPLCEIAGILEIANSKSVVAGRDIAGAASSVMPIVRSRAAIALRKMLSAVPSAGGADKKCSKGRID